MELLLYQIKDFFLKITFEWLDRNNDGYLSEIDLFLTLKDIENNNILKVLSFDISNIIQYIIKKKVEKGTYDDSSYKLKSMMKKISHYIKKFREEGSKQDHYNDQPNKFFDFLTQMYTSAEQIIEHSPEKSCNDDSPKSNKRIHNFNASKRK